MSISLGTFYNQLTSIFNLGTKTQITPSVINVTSNLGAALTVTQNGTGAVAQFTPVGGSNTMTIDNLGNLTCAATISSGTGMMFRNRIINGNMLIDQRNSGAVVTITTNASGLYTLDRFYFIKNGSLTVNVQQVNTPAPLRGFQKCLKLTVGTTQASLTSGDYGLLIQSIEGFNVTDLMWGTSNAETVTVSFWIYANNTGTFSVHLRNNAGNRSYVTNYTVTSSNTWQYISLTIPGDITGTWTVDNTIGIMVDLCFGTGSTYQTTANTWQTGNYVGTSSTTNFFANAVGSSIYITGVQFEKGTVATPFEFRSYPVELQLCQRYYEKGNIYLSEGYVDIVGRPISDAINYKVQKRDIPSSIVYTNTNYYGTGSGINTPFNYTDMFVVSYLAGGTGQTYCYTQWATSSEF